MKKVLITGASSGIGKALALAYAKKGFTIGLTARREDILHEVAQECKNLGGTPFVYKLDVQDAEKCKSVAEKFIKDAGGIDIAIANAGIGGDDGLYTGSSEQINSILNTNILGVTNTLMPFLPALKAQKSAKKRRCGLHQFCRQFSASSLSWRLFCIQNCHSNDL